MSFFVILTLVIGTTNCENKLLNLLSDADYADNVIPDEYQALDKLLSLHKTDHTMLNVEKDDPARQDFVNVRIEMIFNYL